jgi:peroxiredoxin Q/BCP
MLAVGDTAPLFVAAGTGGDIDLADLLKHGPVVLYFFPRAFTGGCTLEAVEFNHLLREFAALGIGVVGISVDPVARLQRFRERIGLDLHLGSDHERTIGAAYGTLRGDVPTTHERDTFLVASDGIVRLAYQRVSPKGHASSVLADVKRLRSSGVL